MLRARTLDFLTVQFLLSVLAAIQVDLEFCEFKGLEKRQCSYPEAIPNDRTEKKHKEGDRVKTEGRKGGRGKRARGRRK